MQDKTKTKKDRKPIKVQDLAPKKDAKGGVLANVSTNHQIQRHQTQGHQIQGRNSNT
jgi:hypothetical protein